MAPVEIDYTNKYIIFIAGEDEYESEKTLLSLANVIRTKHHARVSVLTSFPTPANQDNHPGMECLEGADLVVLYIRFRKWPMEQFKHLLQYLHSGKPIIAIRTTTHAFQYSEDDELAEWNYKFGVDVVGAPWIRHFGHSSSTDVSIAWGAREHPITHDISSHFHVRSWLYYTLPYPDPGSIILLNGYPVNPEIDLSLNQEETPRIHPVAWVRHNEWGGRVFTTTMGHPQDFDNPAFRRLIMNAVQWALGQVGDLS